MKPITVLCTIFLVQAGALPSQAQTDDEIIKRLQGKWLTEDNETISAMTFQDGQFELITLEKGGEKKEVMVRKGAIEISRHKGLLFFTQQATDLSVYGSKQPVRDNDSRTELFIIKKGKLFTAVAFTGDLKIPDPQVVVWDRPKPND